VVWPPSARETAREAIEELMRERGLAEGFDEAVLRAAEAARERVPAGGASQLRRDLTGLPTFTVDPQSARDFDDAVSAEALAGERVRVWVHIADVAAFVQEGSAVDVEARRRGTSVYVPGGVRPMLPDVLSGDACSLVAGAERLAVTAELELHGADVLSASFYRSVIRSDARLHYEQVDGIFAGHESAQEPCRSPLAAARQAAAALADARERRGALAVESQEPEFSFDHDGNVSEIHARTQTEAHRLIEHLMIAANEAVARLLAQRRVPCLYRVHEPPDPDSIVRLADQLASLEVPTPPLPGPMSSAQASEIVGEISRLVEQTVRRNGHGRAALGALVLRSLKQAYYLPTNLGHAGLRSAAYCHFTSPIRRYPDLVCHRALLSAVGAGERAPRASELPELGVWTSEREREAMVIERDADDVARCFALEQSLYEMGWEQVLGGEVVGLISAGAFIAFGGPVAISPADAQRRAPEPSEPADGAHVYEGFLPVRRMRARPPQEDGAGPGRSREGRARERAGDWWELNELGTIMRAEPSGATLRLGEQIDVRVGRVEAARGRVDLLLAEDERGH
jgi:ribonuclease R